MLNLTETLSRRVIRTVQQFVIKLMHPSEKFHKNLFVKFFVKDVNFPIRELKQSKILVWSLWSCFIERNILDF